MDDEEILLELGKVFLEKCGNFIITTAPGVMEAFSYLETHQVDVIVSDYQMPGKDGIDFLKELKSAGNTTPFILFTGRGREEVVIEALNNGADFYLQKGGDSKAQFAELSNKIRYAVSRRGAMDLVCDLKRREEDIINFLPDATFAIDADHVVIAWNKAMEDLTGVPASTILGTSGFEYSVPFYHTHRPMLIDLILQDSASVRELYPYIEQEGDRLISEISLSHFNDGKGGTFWFIASPLYNKNNTVVGAIESIREITEKVRIIEELQQKNEELGVAHEEILASDEELRVNYEELFRKNIELDSALEELKASEEELRFQYEELDKAYKALGDSEERYRAFIENAVVGIYQTLESGRLVSANDAFARMFGYADAAEVMKASPLVGRDLYANPDERSELLQILQHDRVVSHKDLDFVRRDGSLFRGSLTARVVTDGEGNIVRYEGTIVDLSALKRDSDKKLKQ